jgi:hypothetical protein
VATGRKGNRMKAKEKSKELKKKMQSNQNMYGNLNTQMGVVDQLIRCSPAFQF